MTDLGGSILAPGVIGLPFDVPEAVDIRLEGRLGLVESVTPTAAAFLAAADAAIELTIEARSAADREGGRVESRSPSRLGGLGAPTLLAGLVEVPPPTLLNPDRLLAMDELDMVVGESAPSPRANPAIFAVEGLPIRGIALPRMTLDLR